MGPLASLLVTALAVAPPPPALELVAPRPGSVLESGSMAWIEWRPLERLADRGFEEWEAFLSLDGGRTYGVRLTPHLDVERSRFGFEVPPVASEEARLLLRFGDERTEVSVDVPFVFAIRSGPLATGVAPTLTTSRGEAARPGERGVAVWIDGSREGGSLRRRRAAPEPDGLSPAASAPTLAWWPAAPIEGAPSASPPAVSRTAGRPPPTRVRPVAGAPTAGGRLALTQRRNE